MVGLLHPGEMGAAVAACLTGRGDQVLWVPGRARPGHPGPGRRWAGLTAASRPRCREGQAADLARRADIILSICPPHAALEVARAVAATGFTGVDVDANAIAPAPPEQGGCDRGERPGARYGGDGSIVACPPPPVPRPEASPGGTRQHLAAGPEGGDGGGPAAQVAALFEGTPLTPEILRNENRTAASALKMAYASWTKGSAALLLAARALARAEGVEDSLLAEWSLSQPGLAGRSLGAARSAAAKGWRWVGEMEEIAASMTADGLPGGFHQAAAEVFRRSSPGAAEAGGPDDALIGAVLATLLPGSS